MSPSTYDRLQDESLHALARQIDELAGKLAKLEKSVASEMLRTDKRLEALEPPIGPAKPKTNNKKPKD